MIAAIRNISIKWKLSLALITTGLGLVLVYIFLAKGVFEKDKISYVFDSQQSRLTSINREIEGRLKQIIFSSRSLLANISGDGKISSIGQQLFDEDAALIGIEIWNESTQQPTFRLVKPGVTISASNEKIPDGQIKLIPQPEQRFLLLFHLPQEKQEKSAPLTAHILMDAHDILPLSDVRQPTLLIQGQQMIASVGTANVDRAVTTKLVEEFGKGDSDLTKIWTYGKQRFLVSSGKVPFGELRTLVLTPENEALGALNTLFSRSMVFLAFSIFGLIAISVFLSASLTINLKKLTLAATGIGRGEFHKIPVINTTDEMGILSNAFGKMTSEIQRLLVETLDKARMESELKTAKIVQESLLPEFSTLHFGKIEVNGIVITSTECGGDWWYYFKNEKEVYVAIADATGHGTPAALITAAARSIFSRLESEILTLPEMMRAWDFAISSCSKQKVFMTGILLKIDSQTGKGSYLSAGHEAPFLFVKDVMGTHASFLDLDVHPALGEGQDELQEQNFELTPGSTLVLFTDGLFSVEPADGKKLSDKRFLNSVANHPDHLTSAEGATTQVLHLFNEHRQSAPLPDDVTIVSIHRQD